MEDSPELAALARSRPGLMAKRQRAAQEAQEAQEARAQAIEEANEEGEEDVAEIGEEDAKGLDELIVVGGTDLTQRKRRLLQDASKILNAKQLN